MNNFVYFFVILSVAGFVWSSPIQNCQDENIEGLQDRIHIEPCDEKKSCHLPKERNVTVLFRIFPTETVNTLNNNVEANVGPVRLPFVGVDGAEACGNIYEADDVTPAPCPLIPNKEYIYRHVFPVLPFYPEISTTVTWSLNSGKKKVICFEVPIKIVKKKNSAKV